MSKKEKDLTLTEEKLNTEPKEEVLTKKQAKKALKEKQELQEKADKDKEEELRREKKILDKQTKIEKKLERKLAKARKRIVSNPSKSKRLKKKYLNIERYEPDINVGLTEEQVDLRLKKGLNNFTSRGSTKTIPQIIFGNIFTFFNMLTFAIAGWLISIGSIKDLTFLVIVTANMIIGIIQEIKAKKTIDRLSLIAAPTVEVIRDGKKIDINVEEIVLDDLMVLDNGRQICSDAVVVDGTIEVNESLLTGEADEIIKNPGDTLYSGSFVTSGKCIARVEKVGSDNYIERLTGQAKKYKKPKSELMKSLKRIITFMACIIIPMGVGLFYIQYYKNGMDYMLAVRKTAGAMIGMIPSGLYLVTSVALAVGVVRLAKSNVLVQELYCIEMLARIDVLCLDKTGTITDGSMNVKNVIDYNIIDGLTTKQIVSAMLNATNDQNMTNQALEEKFGRAKRFKHTDIIPFSSKRKFSAATFEKYGTFVLGAPEFVLKENYHQIETEVTRCAKEGYRVLVVAHTKSSIKDNTVDHLSLKPVSLILIEDNIRPDAIETISYFKRSGVEVKVISGDNPITVSKVSERAGIENATEYISLDGLSDAEVIRAASKYTVFGRVSPTQKKLLVQTLQQTGKKVAMTGDGVNDILALREADCSIAVASGSEAARNVSHLVLLDSNFSSMPRVVAEGRRVISNIAKVAKLYLTKTIFSFLLACICLIEGSYPISTNQLLMIDLLSIGIPSFALIFEPNNNKAPSNFLKTIISSAIPGAFAIVLQSILVFLLKGSLNMGTRTTSTVICITATFTMMMVLYDTCKPFHNTMRKVLFSGVFSAFVLATLFIPRYFDFSPLTKGLTYYSGDEVRYYWNPPVVTISKQDYYIIDDYVLDTQCYNKTAVVSYYVDSNGVFNITNTFTGKAEPTNYKPVVAEYSSTMDNKIVIGGTKIEDVKYSSNATYSIKSSSDGYLIVEKTIGSYVSEYETNVNVLPKVTIQNNIYYVNGMITNTKTGDRTVGKVTLTANFDVLVDGESIDYNIYGETGILLSHNDNHIFIGGQKSEVNYEEGYIKIDNKSYILYDNDGNRIETGIEYNPTIAFTDADHYIIDGYYSEYKVEGNGAQVEINLTEDGYLKLGTTKTDIKQTYSIIQGPNPVEPLPIKCIILLVCLCMSSLQLIKIMKSIIPATKIVVKKVTDVVTNLQ